MKKNAIENGEIFLYYKKECSPIHLYIVLVKSVFESLTTYIF